MGEHKGHAFIVNVQLSAEDERSGALIAPPEYGSVNVKLMRDLSTQLARYSGTGDRITAAQTQ